MSVRFSSIKVENFRGLAGSIELDFSSPITLIYAPNGTGKTTLLQAAELLFTRRIRSKRINADMNNCWNECKCLTKKDEFSIGGEISGDRVTCHHRNWEINKSRWHGSDIVNSSFEYLKSFATYFVLSADNNDYDRQLELLQNHLWGKHFFYQDSLSTMVDSESSNLREQIFYDLLGISHLSELNDTAQNFKKQLNTHLKLKERQEKNIIRLMDATGKMPPDSVQYEHIFGDIKKSINACISFLNLPDKLLEGINDLDQIVNLRHRISNRLDRFAAQTETRKSTIDNIRQLADNIAQLKEKANAAGADRRDHLNNLANVSTQIAQKKQQINMLNKEVASFAAQHSSISDICEHIASTITSILTYHPEISSKTVEEIFKLNPYYKVDHLTRKSLLQSASDLLDAYPQALENFHQLDRVRYESNKLSNLVKDETAKASILEGRLDQAQSKQASLRSQLAKITDDLTQLKVCARNVLPIMKTQNVCPICGHDWKTAQDLHNAISSTTDLGADYSSSKEAQLRQSLERISQEIDALTAGIGNCNSNKDRLSMLRLEITEREQRWNDYISSCKRLVDDFDFADIHRSLKDIIRCLNVAGHLAQLWHDMESIHGTLDILTPEKLSLLELRDALSRSFETALEGLKTKDTATRQDLHRDMQELSALELAFKQASDNHTSAMEIINALQRNEVDFKLSWEAICNDKPFSDQQLLTLKHSVQADSDIASNARNELANIDANISILTNAAERDKLHLSADKINKSIELLNERIKSCDNIIEFNRQQFSQQRRAALSGLKDVMFALFSRMNTNSIFNKVDFSSHDNQINITDIVAYIENGVPLSPAKYFSRGQRQDLALSIFLARAREAGGTYFLDEPFAHLDDLNRVAVIDIVRMLAIEQKEKLNLVITTASDLLMNLLIAKFTNIKYPTNNNASALTVYQLSGNARNGVTAVKKALG